MILTKRLRTFLTAVCATALLVPALHADELQLLWQQSPADGLPYLGTGNADRGVVVERIPVAASGWPDEDRLAERMHDPRVRVVAVSLVQFSNGYAVDLDRLSRAARASNT